MGPKIVCTLQRDVKLDRIHGAGYSLPSGAASLMATEHIFVKVAVGSCCAVLQPGVAFSGTNFRRYHHLHEILYGLAQYVSA